MADTRTLTVKLVGDASSLQRTFTTSSRATRQFSSELGRAERGVAAGSGVFRSFGRSIAFASGGFLAFGGAAAFLRKSIDAAKEAQVAQAQLATQLRNSGKNFADYRGQINETILRISALAGIENDELSAGLTTILRTTPNVGKALRDLGTAADLARAKHISLANAATIIAKTEAGNTTLLRRQGIQIKANATSEEALAKLRQVVAGQARAGTTEQERFGAVLHDTEEIIGTGILPTLNKYLVSGTKWLQQMNESGKLQRDVASAAHDFESAMRALSDVIKTVDRFTGGFKNTLEILVGIKIAGWARNLALEFGLIGTNAKTAEGRIAAFQSGLAGLAAVTIAPIVIPIEFKFAESNKNPLKGPLERAGANAAGALGAVPATGEIVRQAIAKARDIAQSTNLSPARIGGELAAGGFGNIPEDELEVIVRVARNQAKAATAAGGAMQEAAAKAAHGLGLIKDGIQKLSDSANDLAKTKRTVALTAQQRNTFFDNAISRILQRGGLGDLQQQLAAIEKAKGLLDKRLAATKDITRRLNLEDQILSLTAQEKGIRTQIAQNALQQRQTNFDNIIASLQLGVTKAQATSGFNNDLEALQKLQDGLRAEIKALGATADLKSQLFDVAQQIKTAKQAQISASEFFTLGLSPTGEARVPLAETLRKQLGTIQDAIKGTPLDTKATESQLSRIRKVLSQSIVPTDVRQKVAEMLAGVRQELNKQTTGDQTKFAHQSAENLAKRILNNLGLPASPAELRKLEGTLAVIGPNGTVPSGRSGAFNPVSGGGKVEIHTHVDLDGQQIAHVVTDAQQRGTKRRRPSRRG